MNAEADIRGSGEWLVIGHGSVGSALVRRIVAAGARAAVYDPKPRVAVAGAEYLPSVAAGGRLFARAVSCVAPAAAVEALAAVRPLLGRATLYLDWNTLTPEAKRVIAAEAPCPVVDVALMDTLDSESAAPSLAISGPQAGDATPLLAALGFRVDIVGSECGDAALLKLARSLFMKSLEALVVEFEAAIAVLPGRDVVVASIERNLGERFTAFSRMLLETDRIHAARRSPELDEALSVYGGMGRSVHVATAAADVLRAAAAAWREPDAPEIGAGGAVLARFLAERLNPKRLTHAPG